MLFYKQNQVTMNRYIPLIAIMLLSTTLSSCELVEGIFKAGVWTGIIAIVVVLVLIIWLISKVFGRRD